MRRTASVDGGASNSVEPIYVLSSSDDAESVKPAGCSDMIRFSAVDLNSSPYVSDTGDEAKRRGKKRKKRSKKKGASDADESVVTNLVDGESSKTEAAEVDDTLPIQTPAEPEQPDNLILRKLLRGPRYFDPPDTSWGHCYNCGEQGHSAVNCTAEKKKKPCYYCGSTEHSFKKCTKGRDCFICKTGGHKAKDCPERSTSLNNGSSDVKICLKCGDSGHDMFSCKNNYFSEDLKAIQCYVCSDFGHLCCYNSADHVPKEVSCYKCGSLGHTGLACARLLGETAGTNSPSLCYSCGQGGHFARECPHPPKVCGKSRGEKADRAFSLCHSCGKEGHFSRDCPNSLKARSRLNGEFHGGKLDRSCHNCGAEGHFARECPNPFMDAKSGDPDTSRRNRKIRFDENGLATYSEPKKRGGWITEDPTESPLPYRKAMSSRKRRGGWITEDPMDLPPPQKKANKNSRWSPGTPTSWRHQIHPSNGSGQTSGSQSYGHNHLQQSGASESQGSTHQRFPASRFYNYSNNYTSSRGKSGNWW
uniref:CCHC-type domain-containing protein n=1 Tax=Kalanchoe fedtschenkoi TaxID=63787 RepID=A0A7N0UEH8_KALFE